MRWLVLIVVLIAAGCAGAPEAPTSPSNATTQKDGAVANVTTPAPLVGERDDVFVEHFVLAANRSLAMANASVELPVEKVPELFSGTAFIQPAGGAAMKAWEFTPARRPFEMAQDITLTIRYSSDQPAAAFTKAASFAPVGGWLGTKDRFAVFFQATDAPDSLEAGKVYSSKITIKMPPGGVFIREGEALAITPFLVYQTADNSPLSYVVGGPDPAGFALPHVHFNVSAPNETILLEKAGTFNPNPHVSTTEDPSPTIIEFDVPKGVAFLVAELVATPTAPGSFDADLSLSVGSEVLGQGTGPLARETVVLGPTALAKASGKISAKITQASVGGGSFKLVVTAYGQ